MHKTERSNFFKQNFLMLLCTHAHYVEHILIVPLIKYHNLLNKRVIIFYVIIQTILCVYYLQEIVFFLYQLSYLSKPKKKTDWNGENFNWVWVSHCKQWSMLKSIDTNTKYTHILDGILCIFWEEFYQTAELHWSEKQTCLKTNVFVMKSKTISIY